MSTLKSYRRLALVFIVFFTLACIYPGQVDAQTFKDQHAHARVVSHSTLENFTGTSDYLVGQINLADSTVDFYLDLSTLSTGVELRDEHMQEEFLETGKYPFAQFSGKLQTPFDPASTDTQEVRVKGTFKIHGVSRHVEVKGQMARHGRHLFVHAAWQLQLPDYDIQIPRVLFMKVSKTQQLSVTANMKEKAQHHS